MNETNLEIIIISAMTSEAIDTIRGWEHEIISFVPNVLETCSLLHVVFLVFLRLLAILKPYDYEPMKTPIRHIFIATIWILSAAVHLLAAITQSFTEGNFYLTYRWIVLHVFHTLPIVSIVFMYATMVWVLKIKVRQQITQAQRTTQADISGNVKNYMKTRSKKMTAMVERIVLFILICYLPYLAWWQYFLCLENRDWKFSLSEVIIDLKKLL